MIRAKDLLKVYGARPTAARPLLERGCGKDEIFAQTRCTVAVRDVRFEVAAGELFVIMGLYGSGKSTLLRMLNRLVEPTGGEVEIDGRNLGTLVPRELRALRNRRISMVFQHFALFPHRSVRENASYGLRVRGSGRRELDARTDWALQSVGLHGVGDAQPSELSGGMRQRVGLARALATDADVLLLDEPFSALDPLIRRDMQDLLSRLHRELGRTMIFVTHDLNEAMRIGQRIMLMKDGRVVQIGTGMEILSAPADPYVARFISDVDRARILTAGQAMHAAAPATIGDDPGAVLRRLRFEGVTTSFVVADERVVGLIDETRLAEAVRAGAAGLDASMLIDGHQEVPPNTRLIDVCPLLRHGNRPVAVVDAGRRLLGTLSPQAIVSAIASPAQEGAADA